METTEAAFTTAKKVFDGELSQTEGARQLNTGHGINFNSAKIMITVYGKMVEGLEFKRALSEPDMNYYLARIMAEGGSKALTKPVEALWKHISYYEAKNKVTLKSLRELHSSYSALEKGASSLDGLDESFDAEVRNALRASKTERKKRITESSAVPKTKSVLVQVHERNPYVVAEVLTRANGFCERCNSAAPFIRRKDNSPYLEVHHKTRLADGGEDTVENAVALCPNCHRDLHFGKHNKVLRRTSR